MYENLKFGDLVAIEWVDAYSSWGWHGADEHEKETHAGLSECIHVGVFVKVTKDAVMIAHGLSSRGNRDGLTVIPINGITDLRVLEKSSVEVL